MTQPAYTQPESIPDIPTFNGTANPATPDVAGVAGPAPSYTSDPWPGRSATVYAAVDESAASYGAILAQAQQSPGTTVSTASVPGPENSGAGTYGT